MKSGLAAMILAATDKNIPKNIGFLFYIDEEYDFAGIKKFISDYGKKLKPKSIISLDGSELEIANGCRGLIEISATVKGISCHAATPEMALMPSRLPLNQSKIEEFFLNLSILNLALLLSI